MMQVLFGYRRVFSLIVFVVLGVLSGSILKTEASSYDPLAVSTIYAPQAVDLVVKDTTRDREIPILVYLPENNAPAPVVLFSHGLGGSRYGSAYLGRHWALRGYVVVFIQHPGSDSSVWQNKPRDKRMPAMENAASVRNFMLRVKDVPAVLDQLEIWNAARVHPLAGRLDLKRVGMSGHSFGAITTQAVSGESFLSGAASLTDTRIKAAIIFSPSSPKKRSPAQAFAKVKIPWMLMTGTKDIAPIGSTDLNSRLGVFPALPAGDKYEVVLYEAEHSAFTDRALPQDRLPRNPNHHRAILALSTAFWDAWLGSDAQAKDWLAGSGPGSVLENKDRWQTK